MAWIRMDLGWISLPVIACHGGAADNDPSGNATYSQGSAGFSYSLLMCSRAAASFVLSSSGLGRVSLGRAPDGAFLLYAMIPSPYGDDQHYRQHQEPRETEPALYPVHIG